MTHAEPATRSCCCPAAVMISTTTTSCADCSPIDSRASESTPQGTVNPRCQRAGHGAGARGCCRRAARGARSAGAVLVGNSVGGNVAVRLAIQRPDLVKGLVIIDGGGFEGPQPLGRVFVALMSRPGFLRRIYPSFSWVYMRSRTAADHRARSSAIAITRANPGLQAVTEIWRSFASPEHDLPAAVMHCLGSARRLATRSCRRAPARRPIS